MGTLKITKKHHKHLNNPFPSTPKSLPFIQGRLIFNSQTVPSNKIFSVGKDFQLLWSIKNGGSLSIYHQSQPTKTLWSTIPGQAFVTAALCETEVEESRGSFAVKDRNVYLLCDHQKIEDIRVISEPDHHFDQFNDLSSGNTSFAQKNDLKDTQFPALMITGWLFSNRRKKRHQESGIYKDTQFATRGPPTCARYWVLFDQKNNNQIGFQVRVGPPNFEFQQRISPTPLGRHRRLRWKLGKIRRRKLGWFRFVTRSRGFVAVSSSSEEEMEMKAAELTEFNRICITYSSEGNERFYGFGEQFSHMDFKGKRVPVFVQEQGIGRGDQPITFAANLGWGRLEYNLCSFTILHDIYDEVSLPSEIIENFTENIGRPPELPKWIISGAVVGMQGGTEAVRRVWDELKDHSVPISAFWLQDWVGQRETMIGSQLWWNWEVDTTRYHGWQQLIKDLGAKNIKVMTYCNPCLAPTDKKPNRRRNLFEEAKKLDILVKDKCGEPYMVPNTAFDVGMLDLTHPDTAAWFKQVLQEMVDDGVKGWMADFGEGLPLDVTLYSGEDPISAHNRYPELWAQINREFMEEWKLARAGKEREDPEEALVFFMRAGFRDSPKWGMLFWEGDQMVSWQANDGIKSSVVGLLSSGISGYAFNHSDIGGYCAVNLPFIKYHRSEELLMRWMELNAFTTVFRTHEGNKPSCNSQFYSNHKTLSHFARCAKLYKAWYFYRTQLVKEAAQKGLPVCRHLFIHYPNDRNVHSLSYQQFLIGTEILVVPVLDKGKKNVKAYFPEGETCSWQHIWSGKLFKEHGSEAWVEAPVGYPPVFIKAGSTVGETFVDNLRNFGIL